MMFLSSIREKTRRELDIEKLGDGKERTHMRWFGHENNGRIPREIVDQRCGGKSRIGIPRKRWEDEIRDDVRRRHKEDGGRRSWTSDRRRKSMSSSLCNVLGTTYSCLICS